MDLSDNAGCQRSNAVITSRNIWDQIKINDPNLTTCSIFNSHPVSHKHSNCPMIDKSEFNELGQDIGSNVMLQRLEFFGYLNYYQYAPLKSPGLFCKGVNSNQSITNLLLSGTSYESFIPFIENKNNKLQHLHLHRGVIRVAITTSSSSLGLALIRRGVPLHCLQITNMGGFVNHVICGLMEQLLSNPDSTPEILDMSWNERDHGGPNAVRGMENE